MLPTAFARPMLAPVGPHARAASRSIPSLPRLPMPDLHNTLQKYLKSLEPFLLEDEARGGPNFNAAHAARLKLVEDFERGIGQVCQARLIELNKKSPNNWLNDQIWLKKAYHEWRAPLIVNSNWWLALGDDSTIPPAVRYPSGLGNSCTPWQIRRAAWLVHRILEFKVRLERQELYPDTTRTGLWFRHSALQVFNKCRIPQRECDRFPPTPGSADPDARKILVMVGDWMYAVEIAAQDGSPLPVAVIETKLRAVVADVDCRRERGERAVAVGVLSTDDRDRWANNLTHLLSLSPANRAAFTAVTNSVFALSLDQHVYTLPAAALPSPTSPSRFKFDPDLAAHLHNVRSGHYEHPGHNRWYDKAFTLIVEANTRAGVLGEHSPIDALVPSIVADYAIVQEVDEAAFPHPLTPDDASSLRETAAADSGKAVEGWERLDWVVDARIEAECVAAAQRAKAIVDDSDNDELVYTSYGVDWIKDQARFSPDAYIQLALQLAWYRTRGSFTATYETALTRLFKHGRTETIRTLTADARAWVLSMASPSISVDARLALLRRALQTHTQLTREAATGRGIDRHLLGLRLMLRADAGERHALFEDELFTRSQEWKLSTSGLSAGYQFRGTGFGTLYEDGYGVNYMPAPDIIRFGIESKHSCPETSTQLFKIAIHDALEDMRALCTAIEHAHL
ncbi:acyltransferase ChoActase/COT/CPT [Lenzites betulinus]|nr:acyltransferase ChoActase/COT/CPT [Lenzites betulinus]